MHTFASNPPRQVEDAPLVWHEFDFGELRRTMPEPAVRQILAVHGLLALPAWEFTYLKDVNNFWHFFLGKKDLVPGERQALALSLANHRCPFGRQPSPALVDPYGMVCAGVAEVHHVPSLLDVSQVWLNTSLLGRRTHSGLATALALKEACSLEQLQIRLEQRGLTAVRFQTLMPAYMPSGLYRPPRRSAPGL